MTIYPMFRTIMKYRLVQSAAEAYYRYRTKRPCFVIKQNDRWTLVTIER